MNEGNFTASRKCVQFDSELMAYLEGESRPFVNAHAQECPFCRAVLTDLNQVQSVARDLPLDEPPTRLWANVRAQLEHEGVFTVQGGRWAWLGRLRFFPEPVAVTALAGLAVLGTILLVSYSPVRPTTTSYNEASSSSLAPVAASVAANTDSDLVRMIKDLETTFKANEKFLEPENRATYEKSLASLDTSIRECKDSLRQQPDNALAQDYLMAAYTQKVDVLTSALEFQGR